MSEKITPQQTLEQRRAKDAYAVVERVKAQFAGKLDQAKKFGGHARKLPTRIIASGLGQALAFLKAKDYAPDLLVALSEWVLSVVKPSAEVSKELKKPDESLLKAVILSPAEFLRQATDEALAYLLWLNRFCEASKLTDDAETN